MSRETYDHHHRPEAKWLRTPAAERQGACETIHGTNATQAEYRRYVFVWFWFKSTAMPEPASSRGTAAWGAEAPGAWKGTTRQFLYMRGEEKLT